MLQNPILPGFNPDPCLCRRGDDYYLAISTFEWFPGVPVYHSRDLKHWTLLTHCMQSEDVLDLRRLPSAKGVWAPCLTWSEADGLFFLVFSIMNSTNARFFDVDNYLITAPDILGPWSAPVYLHSAGFDASLFHDDDGRKWLSGLEWEFRDGYEQPGAICLVEYNHEKKEIIGYPKRIWHGGTDRGCIEGPHIYKRNGTYYLLCAEGGTGYGHCVTMGRAKDIWGPYESDPANPILTSTATDFNERDNSEYLKPHHYNPAVTLQKAGHASLVETSLGETYLAHHAARPFAPELRCTLGRETCLQKMEWTQDGWLRLTGGGNLVAEYVPSSALPDVTISETTYAFSQPGWYAPRINPASFAAIEGNAATLRGQESLSSCNRVSLLARRLTCLSATVTVRMTFTPEVYQHYAGLVLYYDNMDYVMLRKYWSQTLSAPALCLLQVDNGHKTEELTSRVAVAQNIPLWLRLFVSGQDFQFAWSEDGVDFQPIGPIFDTSCLSDEYCKHGEFTGTMTGVFCVDSLQRKKTARFEHFSLETT